MSDARREAKGGDLRFMTSCMQVELPQKPTDILRPFGGMSQIAHLRLFGIHSTKYDEFLFWTLSDLRIVERWERKAGRVGGGASRVLEHLLVDPLVDMRPRKRAHVR